MVTDQAFVPVLSRRDLARHARCRRRMRRFGARARRGRWTVPGRMARAHAATRRTRRAIAMARRSLRRGDPTGARLPEPGGRSGSPLLGLPPAGDSLSTAARRRRGNGAAILLEQVVRARRPADRRAAGGGWGRERRRAALRPRHAGRSRDCDWAGLSPDCATAGTRTARRVVDRERTRIRSLGRFEGAGRRARRASDAAGVSSDFRWRAIWPGGAATICSRSVIRRESARSFQFHRSEPAGAESRRRRARKRPRAAGSASKPRLHELNRSGCPTSKVRAAGADPAVSTVRRRGDHGARGHGRDSSKRRS